MVSLRLIVVFTVACVAGRDLPAQTDADSWAESVVQRAVERVTASVVQIETVGGLDRIEGRQVAAGPTTGLVVSEDGYVVTSSFNLSQQPAAVFVKWNANSRYPAEIVARNHSRQVVLLKVETGRATPVPSFLPRAELRVGQSVIAVGKAFDADSPNLSTGILSATNRIWGKAIQTDAKISPHNFGGPLLDLEGNVLGLLVPLSPQQSDVAGSDWYDSGIGFAVPLDELRLDQLSRGQDLHAGLSGIEFRQDRGYASPAIVAACPINSPAGQAGLKPGDNIIRINQASVQRATQVRQILGPLYAGDEVEVVYQRDGKAAELKFQLVAAMPPFRHAMMGIVPGVTSEDKAGVVVRGLIPDSPAARADIRLGDRVIEINGAAVANSLELAERMITLAISESVTVKFVRQDDQPRDVTFELAPLHAEAVELESDETLAGAATEVKLTEIKIPEQPNRCFAFVPSQSAELPRGALLWLGPPGKLDEVASGKHWQPLCEKYNLVVILPESRNPTAWDSSEADFVARVVQQSVRQFDVDPRRVAVGGSVSGGVMASIVAMNYRDLIRGLVLHNSAMSERIKDVKSTAVDRLMVLFVVNKSETARDRRIERHVQQLSNSGFPVHLINQPAATSDSEIPRQRIVHWLDIIDRL